MSSKALGTIRTKVLTTRVQDTETPRLVSRLHSVAPVLDFAALLGISSVVFLVASTSAERALPESALLVFGALFCVAEVLLCKRLGLYAPLPVESNWSEFKVVVKAAVLTQFLSMSGLYLGRVSAVTPPILAALGLTTTLWLMASRQLRSTQTEQRIAAGVLSRNVLIVGRGKIGRTLQDHFRDNRRLGYVVRGFLDDCDQSHDVLGTTRDVERIIRTQFIDHIYITTHADRELVKKLTLKAPQLGVDVSIVPDLFDGIAWNAPVDRVAHFPVLVLHRRHAYALQRLMKRGIDFMASLVGAVLLAPVLAIVALAIKLESPGPVFYRATRVGRKGRIFSCYKFRTMYQGADERVAQVAHLNERSAPLFKISKDPRITPLGRFLRKYSVDELPQLANVLLGEMSLVGPRPPPSRSIGKSHSSICGSWM